MGNAPNAVAVATRVTSREFMEFSNHNYECLGKNSFNCVVDL